MAPFSLAFSLWQEHVKADLLSISKRSGKDGGQPGGRTVMSLNVWIKANLRDKNI